MNVRDTVILVPTQHDIIPNPPVHLITKRKWRVSDGKRHPITITKVKEERNV